MNKTKAYNIDCMEYMATLPDNYYSLALVDPPYGIDWMEQIKNPNMKANWKLYDKKDWDKNIPQKEYFEELSRVSQNQIIWGGNYMTDYLHPSSCWLIWDKMPNYKIWKVTETRRNGYKGFTQKTLNRWAYWIYKDFRERKMIKR